ncbi:hypothetical protein AAFF_G00389600 [Aldrovandia affinis]|uniref:Uncharacterized protein n=1 Tax=Aldrovandia affinis TaxID=143900 RepID=A0AAD7SEH4_9TELE|nr:hypothetical protein AAFF_G00389600 [Aldrovandia affinis]
MWAPWVRVTLTAEAVHHSSASDVSAHSPPVSETVEFLFRQCRTPPGGHTSRWTCLCRISRFFHPDSPPELTLPNEVLLSARLSLERNIQSSWLKS